MQSLDEGTVEALQLRAPAVSKRDPAYQKKKMRLGHLFLEINDIAVRSAVEQRLLLAEDRIPSLFSLTKDLRYLEAPAKAMKALLPKSSKGSLRQNFRFFSISLEQITSSLDIQTSETSYKPASGRLEDLSDLAYRQRS